MNYTKSVFQSVMFAVFITFLLVGISGYFKVIFAFRIFFLHTLILLIFTELFIKINWPRKRKAITSTVVLITISYAILFILGSSIFVKYNRGKTNGKFKVSFKT